MTNAPHIVVAAGGTGGHIFPGLAAAGELRNLAARVSWLGAAEKDREFVNARGGEGLPVFVVPFRSPRGMFGLLRLPFAVLRALKLFRVLRPQAVLGFGGYAAVPGGLAAKLMRVPLLVHEQNAAAGRANKLLAPLAARVLTGFPNALPRGEWTGNPVRDVFDNVASPQERYAAREGALKILVLGGSQGAAAFNKIIPAALARAQTDAEVLHQCGKGNKSDAEKNYLACANAKAEVREFVDDVAAEMSRADLLICRAGAATLAEAAAVGAACFLIPYPHAADGHQRANAEFFANNNAAVCSAQENAEDNLAEFLTKAKREQLLKQAQAARALAKPQAAREVAGACIAVAGGKHAL